MIAWAALVLADLLYEKFPVGRYTLSAKRMETGVWDAHFDEFVIKKLIKRNPSRGADFFPIYCSRHCVHSHCISRGHYGDWILTIPLSQPPRPRSAPPPPFRPPIYTHNCVRSICSTSVPALPPIFLSPIFLIDPTPRDRFSSPGVRDSEDS